MGVAKEQKHASSQKSGKRGSTNNKARLGAFARSSESTGADWGGCSPEWVQSVVLGITRLGGAVIFGLSRDGGSYNLTLLLGGEKETLWFNGNAILDEELRDVVATLDAMR